MPCYCPILTCVACNRCCNTAHTGKVLAGQVLVNMWCLQGSGFTMWTQAVILTCSLGAAFARGKSDGYDKVTKEQEGEWLCYWPRSYGWLLCAYHCQWLGGIWREGQCCGSQICWKVQVWKDHFFSCYNYGSGAMMASYCMGRRL